MKYKAMYQKEKRKKEKLIHLVKNAFINGRVSDRRLIWQKAWFQSPALRELKEIRDD